MSSENIVTGKKYRILKDATNKVWDVISFFTKASDVYNNNNKNLQTTIGSINGISSSLTSTSSDVAASAAAVKALNDKITDLSSNYVISKMSVVPVQVTGTIPINGSQSVTIDTTSYGFKSTPHVVVRWSSMCTIQIINVTLTSITINIYNAWGGSIVADKSTLGQLQAIELTQV